jgi:hypothetical protein
MRAIAFTLALTLSLGLAAQDDTGIRDLIRKLDDSEFQVREDAFNALVKLGSKAVAALKEAAEKGESPEVKLRASEALKAIELAEKTAQVYREPALVTADFKETPVAKAIEEIARQAGVKVEGLALAPEAALTLKLEGVSLLEAMDRVCALQEQLSWSERGDAAIALAKEKHVPGPAAYAGPFRLRVADLTITRKTDFKETTTTATLVLASDHLQYLKPLSRVRFEIAKAVDDKGAELAVKPALGADNVIMGGGGMVIMGVGGLGGDNALHRTFNATGFGPGATGVKSLRGTATFSFPLAHTTLKFSAPASNDRESAGDFAFRIVALRGKAIEFEVARAKGNEPLPQDEIERRLDMESFVLVDGDGKEHKAESVTPAGGEAIMIGPGGVERKVRYRAAFDIRPQNAKEWRFRFIDRTFDKTVAFEFGDVRVP